MSAKNPTAKEMLQSILDGQKTILDYIKNIPTPGPIPNPSAAIKFFFDKNSPASKWVSANPTSPDLAFMVKVANGMRSMWLGTWTTDFFNSVTQMIKDHIAQGATPVFVPYNIPGRDNNGASAGGLGSEADYYSWIGTLGAAIGLNSAMVMLEPDAVALAPGITDDNKRAERFRMLSTAIDILQKQPNVAIYLDGGHPNWLTPQDMSTLLIKAGIGKVQGFFVNASNFETTADCLTYAKAVSALVGNKHFIIDTSRNGKGPWNWQADRPGQTFEQVKPWCNPPGRGLGQMPTTKTNEQLCDAFLWIKAPGESDGPFNGGPAAGIFWPEYAIALGKNAAF